MEPADLAEARQKAEAAELAAQEAELALQQWYHNRKGSVAEGMRPMPTRELAQLTVRAHLLRSLAWRASLEYLAAVERDSEQAWAQAKQAPVTHGREAVFTQSKERSPR